MGPVKLSFADSDLAPLVKRYSSSTIVTMLREIAKCKTAKLDWGMLCKGTSTGITNPKEFQALWRSVAYRAELEDAYDESNESPLEDDSDLEIELDPVPSVSPALAEIVSNFVKSDLQQLEREEARLEQNAVQTGASLQAGALSSARLPQCAATRGEPTATVTCSTSTKVPYSGAVNQADRKRRRLWTPEEDLALIAAVDKCGEGNWTSVLKNHYDFDRSASQLSQRWALIRKRREVQEKAGYGIGSGVSPLASGYKDLRPEGLKSGALAVSGSQLGTPKDAGKVGNVSMSIKQPLSSTSSVPVSKRIPVASGPETTPASVLETQRVRALPASGVSSSWAGQRPQPHGPASMRAGASQLHKGASAERMVRRPAQGPSIGNPVFYTSTQTSTVPIDSKYAASRNMGAGVARGGGSKGGHGPDPMIQAAAMAAGARIAPASTAASLLKAAQSGGALAATSTGLQRTSSHHLAKNQTNRSFGSNSASGNSSPLSAPAVPAQGSRNNLQAPIQSSKPASFLKRGPSPQQKTASASYSTTSTPSNPSSFTTPIPVSTPVPSSTSTPAPNSSFAPSLTSTPAPKSTPISNPVLPTSTLAPAPKSSSISSPVPTSALAPPPKSTSISTPVPTSTLAPAPKSSFTSPAVSNPTSNPALKAASIPAPKSSFSSPAVSNPTSNPALKTSSIPTPVSISTSAPAPKSSSLSTSAPTSSLVPATKSTSTQTPVSTSTSTPAPPSICTPAPSAIATSAKAPKSISTSSPALAPTSLPVPASAPVSNPASAPVPSTASPSISTPAAIPVSAPVSAIPASSPKPTSTSVSIPACGFNTAGPGIESPGEVEKDEFSQLLKNVTMSAKF